MRGLQGPRLIVLVVALVVAGMIAGATFATAGSSKAPNKTTGKAAAGKTAGTTAVKGAMYAVVNADGTLARGKKVISSAAQPFTGAYEVIFKKNVRNCAYLATAGSPASIGTQPASYATVVGRATDVRGVWINTFDGTGAPAAEPFHLTAIC